MHERMWFQVKHVSGHGLSHMACLQCYLAGALTKNSLLCALGQLNKQTTVPV